MIMVAKHCVTWKFSTAVLIFFENKFRTALQNADNSINNKAPLESLIKFYNLNNNYFSKIGGRRPRKSNPTKPRPIAQYCNMKVYQIYKRNQISLINIASNHTRDRKRIRIHSYHALFKNVGQRPTFCYVW
jgi:hypothetical protein